MLGFQSVVVARVMQGSLGTIRIESAKSCSPIKQDAKDRHRTKLTGWPVTG